MREYGIAQVNKRKLLISLFVKYWDNNPDSLLSFSGIGTTQCRQATLRSGLLWQTPAIYSITVCTKSVHFSIVTLTFIFYWCHSPRPLHWQPWSHIRILKQVFFFYYHLYIHLYHEAEQCNAVQVVWFYTITKRAYCQKAQFWKLGKIHLTHCNCSMSVVYVNCLFFSDSYCFVHDFGYPTGFLAFFCLFLTTESVQ